MPLPLAMMIPFMGIQSAVMAKQFGENFQYGKRRISAMDNDEFNKLTPAKLMSNANKELADMIPAMKDSIIGMHDFQEFLVREFLIMIDNVIKAGLGELLGLSSESLTKFEQNVEHFLHGHIHFDGVPTETPSEPTTPTVEPVVDAKHLTLSEIATYTDLALSSAINNLSDWDAQTQLWLIAERDRRLRTEEPTPDLPTEEQQTSKLTPDFIDSLSENDLQIGGKRTRNYKGTIMQWEVVRQMVFISPKITSYSWDGSKWFAVAAQGAQNLTDADRLANEAKKNLGASYVVTFTSGNRENYYLIKDV